MKRSIRRRWGLTISLVIYIFGVMVAGMLLTGVFLIILHIAGVPVFGEITSHDRGGLGVPYGGLLAFMGFSSFLGTAIAGFFSKRALQPLRSIIEATRKVAGGDFSVRLDVRGIYELEELSQSFNKMAHELSTIETLRSDFINNFSHEFKTPIVSIRGFAKLLEDETLSAGERREYLDIIKTESDRLASLSTNVLNLSRYENLEIIAGNTALKLDELLRRAVIQTEPKWSKKDIRVNVEADEMVFNGNADLIQQILLNLLDNAIKFSGDGGVIEITLYSWNSGARLSVKDYGIGMDAGMQARIFDKFYQGDPSRVSSGNGLGLSIVKRIVELCGGDVQVQSAPGAGSEFTVWLPAGRD